MTKLMKKTALYALLGAAAGAHAAEGFEPRYNVAGSLGGEIFAPPDQTGWAAGLATTYVPVRKVTGDDGKALTLPVPGGALAVPGLPAAASPTYGPGRTTLDGNGNMTRQDLALAYLTPEQYAGGRLLFVVDVPFARKHQSIALHGDTPALNWPAPVPQPVQSAVAGQFAAQYQGAQAAQGEAATGAINGIGDTELIAGWQYVGEQWRVLGSAALVMPTGKYGTDPQPDVGQGNFRTLRPALQVAYLPTPQLALAAKVSLGLNGRNHDNQLRSGNWWGTELAAGYKTGIGVFGLHALRVQQYQDDDNNPFGASRYRTTNAGAFYTARLPGLGTIVTLQYIDTMASRNAKHSSFLQLRLIQLF
ncbi:transporter [Rugamonas apoptosis]|nr:transporter [Rugamonas apoptosis]